MLPKLRQVLTVGFLVVCVCLVFYAPCIHLIKWTLFTKIVDFKTSSVMLRSEKSNTRLKDFLQSVVKKRLQIVQNCSIREVKLSDHPLPVTGLISFPGSGNTWTRHLIQQMSGLGTSSCYCDETLRVNGFPYECYDNLFKTIVVKTHEFRHSQQFKFNKIVLLIRNPYEAIVSYANFIKRRHTGHASTHVLKQVVAGTFHNSLRWYKHLTKAIIGNFSGPVHILQYEKLETEMADTLLKLSKFLTLNITQRDIDCTVQLQEGNFHRELTAEKRLKLLDTVYNETHLVMLKEATDYTEKLLKGAYGIDLDVGSYIERVLLDNS